MEVLNGNYNIPGYSDNNGTGLKLLYKATNPYVYIPNGTRSNGSAYGNGGTSDYIVKSSDFTQINFYPGQYSDGNSHALCGFIINSINHDNMGWGNASDATKNFNGRGYYNLGTLKPGWIRIYYLV